MKMLLIPICAAGALLISKQADAPATDAVGSVAGTATFQGERPDPKPDFSPKEEEMKGCHHDGHTMDMSDRSLLIDEKGGIANVVVMIDVDGAEVEPRDEPIVMDQMSCRFEPHVQVLRVGETVRFTNSDETNHNIHTFAKKNKNINNNVAAGSHTDLLLDKEETIEIKCDIHPWMKSYAIVSEASHFAVSGPDGTFTIEGLPAGTHKVDYWHETLGKGKAEVVVEAGKPATLALELGGDAKKGGRRR